MPFVISGKKYIKQNGPEISTLNKKWKHDKWCNLNGVISYYFWSDCRKRIRGRLSVWMHFICIVANIIYHFIKYTKFSYFIKKLYQEGRCKESTLVKAILLFHTGKVFYLLKVNVQFKLRLTLGSSFLCELRWIIYLSNGVKSIRIWRKMEDSSTKLFK